MKYLMFIKLSESYRSQPMPKGLMDAMDTFVSAGFKSGALKETGGLRPTSEATRISLRGGKLTVTDGPFTEAKEVVGGYAIVEVKSREEALEIGRQFMDLHRVHWPGFEGESELRPIEEFEPPK
jgi:hypothetical protein